MNRVKPRRTVVDDTALALGIGRRIRDARTNARLTQQQVAEGRYTKAYISALETGRAKPSMAALNFVAERLGLPISHFLDANDARWSRLEADLWLASGRWQEAVDAYDDLLRVALDRSSRAELLRGQAEALCRLGRGMDAIRPATESFELFRELRKDREAMLAGYWLANALYLAGNAAEARSIIRMVLDKVRAGVAVEPDLQMRLLTGASYIETADGNHRAAVTYLEEARALNADLDDRRSAAFLSALAIACYDSGDLEGAIRAGNQSLALFRAADAQHEVALLENNLANAYLAIGNLDRATELVTQAHRQHEVSGDERELANVLDTEARIRLADGDVQAAMDLAARAIAAAEAIDNRKALADAQVTMARAEVQSDRMQQAMEMYEQAAAGLRQHGPRARLEVVLAEWADVVAALGDHEKAYELTREALSRAAPDEPWRAAVRQLGLRTGTRAGSDDVRTEDVAALK
jgi:tetratricopeptide (TPR) repeat protein